MGTVCRQMQCIQYNILHYTEIKQADMIQVFDSCKENYSLLDLISCGPGSDFFPSQGT